MSGDLSEAVVLTEASTQQSEDYLFGCTLTEPGFPEPK